MCTSIWFLKVNDGCLNYKSYSHCNQQHSQYAIVFDNSSIDIQLLIQHYSVNSDNNVNSL